MMHDDSTVDDPALRLKSRWDENMSGYLFRSFIGRPVFSRFHVLSSLVLHIAFNLDN